MFIFVFICGDATARFVVVVARESVYRFLLHYKAKHHREFHREFPLTEDLYFMRLLRGSDATLVKKDMAFILCLRPPPFPTNSECVQSPSTLFKYFDEPIINISRKVFINEDREKDMEATPDLYLS